MSHSTFSQSVLLSLNPDFFSSLLVVTEIRNMAAPLSHAVLSVSKEVVETISRLSITQTLKESTSIGFLDADFLYACHVITSQTKMLILHSIPFSLGRLLATSWDLGALCIPHFFGTSSVYKLGASCIPHKIYMKTSPDLGLPQNLQKF